MLDQFDRQFEDHVQRMLGFLGQKLIQDGRCLKTINLHVDAQTGDVDLNIVDEERSGNSISIVQEQNRLDVVLARRAAQRENLLIARQLVKFGQWQESIDLLWKVEREPSLTGDDEFVASVTKMRQEIERYYHIVICRPDGCEEQVQEARESHWGCPQNLFILVTNGRRMVGRKLLSEHWIDGRISELFCARIRPEMILGEEISFRSTESDVVVYYRPITAAEARQVFDSAAQDQKAEIVFPFVHLTEKSRSEVISPTQGWYVDQHLQEQLFNGETMQRGYALKTLKDLIKPQAVLYDPACSTGDFLATIQSQHPGSRSIGQDLSQEMIEFARKKLDQTFVGDAIESPVMDESVDVVFLRFLNSEVVSSQYAMRLFDRILTRVRVGGLAVMFGHTPLLIDSGFLQTRGVEILRCIGCEGDALFQFYVFRRSGNVRHSLSTMSRAPRR